MKTTIPLDQHWDGRNTQCYFFSLSTHVDAVLGKEEVSSEVDVIRRIVALANVGMAVAVLTSSSQTKNPLSTVIPSSASSPRLANVRLFVLRTH